MADNKFKLTNEDRIKLRNNSTYSLPDNPSDKQFSASQIKKAMYFPSLMLFDWMKEGFDKYDEAFIGFDERFNDKVDKLKTAKKIYITDESGLDSSIPYSIDEVASSIPVRNSDGELLVPESTNHDKSALSYKQFNLAIQNVQENYVAKTGSTMSGNIKFENTKGLLDHNNRNIISSNNEVVKVGNENSPFEIKGTVLKTIDKTFQKVNSADGSSVDYALITDVNLEKARAMAAENDIRNIASGKSKSISISIVDNPDFSSDVAELSYIGTIKDIDGKVYNQTDLKKGDEILIIETNKKDRWFGGNGKFYVLESDTSFLANYQKKLFPDATISLDSLGNIKANISFANLSGEVADSSKLQSKFETKQDVATAYNFKNDNNKTVFYQETPPTNAPHMALWMYKSVGASIKFANIQGSIEDNANSDVYIKNQIKLKTNRSVICSLEPIYSGDNVQLKFLSVNLWEQSSVYNTINLQLANSTTAGLMSYEDYNTLLANTQKIAQLEGRLKRISYDVKDNPTANEIDSYVRGLGYTEEDFPYLKVIVYGTKHMWLYYTRPTVRWQDDGIDAAGIFTNEVAGIIKGAAVAGKVYAESDGTGSVYGWDNLNNVVSGNSAAISSIQSSLPDYLKLSGGEMTGNLLLKGHLLDMGNGRVANVAVGSDDDAVPKSWINNQLGFKLDKITTTSTLNRAYVVTKTGGVDIMSISQNTSGSTIVQRDSNGRIQCGTPTGADHAVNYGYITPIITTLTNDLSDEVDARIQADADMMLIKESDPTTSSEGALGQLWKNKTNGKIFKCDAISGSTYTWNVLGTGGVTITPFNNTSLGTIKGKETNGYVEHLSTDGDGEGHVHGWDTKADVNEVNRRILRLENAPTTSTGGIKGQLAFSENDGKLYQCKNVEGTTTKTYTWEEFTGGGSSVEIDNATIIKDSEGKLKTSLGAYEINKLHNIINGVKNATRLQDNYYLFESNEEFELKSFGGGDYIQGTLTIGGSEVSFEGEVTDIEVEVTGDTYTFPGVTMTKDPVSGASIYLGYDEGESKFVLAASEGDLSTVLTGLNIVCKLKEHLIQQIPNRFLLVDNNTIKENDSGYLYANISVDEETINKNLDGKLETTVGGSENIVDKTLISVLKDGAMLDYNIHEIRDGATHDVDSFVLEQEIFGTVQYDGGEIVDIDTVAEEFTFTGQASRNTFTFPGIYLTNIGDIGDIYLGYYNGNLVLATNTGNISTIMDKLTLDLKVKDNSITSIKHRFIPFDKKTIILDSANEMSVNVATETEVDNYLKGNIVDVEGDIVNGTFKGPEEAVKGQTIICRIVPAPNHKYPGQSSITVTGATIATGGYSKGKLVLENITGNIKVSVTCPTE